MPRTTLRRAVQACALSAAIIFGALQSLAAETLALGLPVDCDMQRVCSIHKFVDHDPSEGRVDYACGRLSNDGDTGTDFRVPNLAVMEAGIAVIAAADGIVRATRDGMNDVSVRKIGQSAIQNRFAGNAVVLTHPGGWETQYSHLKRGSVRVRQGDRVRAGDVLGEIGLSGNTEFPHVEFSVRHNGKSIDPFVGPRGTEAPYLCGSTRNPLWSAPAQAALNYRPSGVLSAGFSPGPPDKERARRGGYTSASVLADSPALVFWVDIFGSEQGDLQRFILTGPDGQTILKNQSTLKKNNIAWFAFAGKKRPQGGWPRGTYTGTYKLVRDGQTAAQTQKTLEIR